MQARQPDRAAVDQRHAPAPAVDAEHGVARGDAQVAPERELEPARDGVALDRGDHRLRRAACASAPSGRRRPRVDAVAAPVGHAPSGRRRRRTCRPRRSAPRPRAPSSASKRRKASASAAAVGPSTALRPSGRSIVTIATGPSISKCTAVHASLRCLHSPLMGAASSRDTETPTAQRQSVQRALTRVRRLALQSRLRVESVLSTTSAGAAIASPSPTARAPRAAPGRR